MDSARHVGSSARALSRARASARTRRRVRLAIKIAQATVRVNCGDRGARARAFFSVDWRRSLEIDVGAIFVGNIFCQLFVCFRCHRRLLSASRQKEKRATSRQIYANLSPIFFKFLVARVQNPASYGTTRRRCFRRRPSATFTASARPKGDQTAARQKLLALMSACFSLEPFFFGCFAIGARRLAARFARARARAMEVFDRKGEFLCARLQLDSLNVA